MRPNEEKILIFHPKDPTTDVLCQIYRDINATVIRNRISKSKLKKLMKEADRIIMMGHGTHLGTGYVDKGFIDSTINSDMVYLLREKKENVFIWCNANIFVEKYNLQGFCTGMFISEVEEAEFFKVDATEKEIEDSNNKFAKIITENILESGEKILEAVLNAYPDSESNVIKYNSERMFYMKKK